MKRFALSFAWLIASFGLTPAAVAEPDPAAEATLALPIPARRQAPESPPSGWCGETAIQEALLERGVWASQKIIHDAGHPSHPDLYSHEIPVALAELGIPYSRYAASGRGFAGYLQWVKEALSAGDPVIAGVKILPTEHPEWGLDHFVLAVGHGKRGLLVNTTWGHRLWADDTAVNGISFKNAFYALRIRRLEMTGGARAAHAAVIEETPPSVRLKITCRDLTAGARYSLEQRAGRWDKTAASSQSFVAKGTQFEQEVLVARDRAARFSCLPL